MKVLFYPNTMQWVSYNPEALIKLNSESKIIYKPLEKDSRLFSTKAVPGEEVALKYYFAALCSDPSFGELTSAQKQLGRSFLHQLRNDCFRYVEQIERTGASLCLYVHGYEAGSAAVRAAAKITGVKHLALENTAHPGRIVWDSFTGLAPNTDEPKNAYLKREYGDSVAGYKGYPERYFANSFSRKHLQHRSGPKRFVKRKHRPMLLYLGQVYTDASVVFGLNKWKTPLEPILVCSEWAKRNGYNFFLKLHPKENNGACPITQRPYQKLTLRKALSDPNLKKNLTSKGAMVDVRNEFDTGSLIESADVVATLNSQAGLEAAMLDKSVIVFGDAFYSGLGFTQQVNPSSNMNEKIDAIMHESRLNDSARFAYYLYENYCLPKNTEALSSLIRKTVLHS